MNSEQLPDPGDEHTTLVNSLQRSLDERYELYEQLGKGGMGTVFRALDRELDRIVAVKILNPELSSSFRYLLQLKREIVLSSRIQNLHVVRVHDLGRFNGSPLISMDYIEGESLFQLLSRVHRLPPSQVCDFATQMCEGLDAIHSAGIIHRDVKPGNVLIDQNGQIIITDFSMARSVLKADLNLEITGENPGTEYYMSPEQRAGLPADHRSDVYSFGLLLLQMLTGTSALESLAPLRQQFVFSESDKNQRAGELRKLAILDVVIRRCLQMDRTDRYGAATEILSELRLAEPVFDASHRYPVEQSAPRIRVSKLFSRAGWILAIAVALCVIQILIFRLPSTPLVSVRRYEDLYNEAMNHIKPESGEPDLRIAVRDLEQIVKGRPGDTSARRSQVEALIRGYEATHDVDWLKRARKACLSAGLSKTEFIMFDSRIDVNEGRFHDAIAKLQGNWSVWKSSEEANRLLGRAFEGSGQITQALPYYREAIRLAPESWLSHNDLGSALLGAGRIDEAELEFTNVIRLNPASRSGYSNLGVALLQAGHFREARQNFEIALQRAISPESYLNLGVAAYYSHQFATSVPFFEAASRMRPNSSKYAAGLADALWHSGQRTAARAAYVRALSLLDTLALSRTLSIEEDCRRARCLGRLGDLAGALSVLHQLSRINGEHDPNLLYSLAVLASENHQPEAVQRWINLAVHQGYSRALANVDPDLALSNSPGYPVHLH